MKKFVLIKFALISFGFLIQAALILQPAAYADVILEYLVREPGVEKTAVQQAAVKDGAVMVKAAGGDGNLDLLYRRAPEEVVIVDHRRRRLMKVDEMQIDRINQQAQLLLPLVQGFGAQIATLSPEQRKRWQKILGDGIPLDMIAGAAGPAVEARLETSGERNVAGVKCRVIRVMHGSNTLAEICMADPAAARISPGDAATMRAFFDFAKELAGRSRELAGLLGFIPPDMTVCGEAVIPVEYSDLSGGSRGSVSLHKIDRSGVPPDLMLVPAGYEESPLTFLP